VAHDPEPIPNAPGQDAPERPTENAAVTRCIRAFQRAYKKELDDLDEDESKFPAEEAGREAYLRALPPLSGFENVRDFVACIAYADLTGIIRQSDAAHFLDSAKVALTLVRYEPGRLASAPKRLGRPPKSSPAEENI